MGFLPFILSLEANEVVVEVVFLLVREKVREEEEGPKAEGNSSISLFCLAFRRWPKPIFHLCNISNFKNYLTCMYMLIFICI